MSADINDYAILNSALWGDRPLPSHKYLEDSLLAHLEEAPDLLQGSVNDLSQDDVGTIVLALEGMLENAKNTFNNPKNKNNLHENSRYLAAIIAVETIWNHLGDEQKADLSEYIDASIFDQETGKPSAKQVPPPGDYNGKQESDRTNHDIPQNVWDNHREQLTGLIQQTIPMLNTQPEQTAPALDTQSPADFLESCKEAAKQRIDEASKISTNDNIHKTLFTMHKRALRDSPSAIEVLRENITHAYAQEINRDNNQSSAPAFNSSANRIYTCIRTFFDRDSKANPAEKEFMQELLSLTKPSDQGGGVLNSLITKKTENIAALTT